MDLAKYRVKIAGEVELGADDNLVEGTEVTVEAYSPTLALLVACQAAVASFTSQMGVDQGELVQQMAQNINRTMRDVLEQFGGPLFDSEESGGDVPDASAPPAVMPMCGCEHRYDHHDGGGPCGIEGCECAEYHVRREVGG